MTFKNITSLLDPAKTKIVMLVMDGLGGMPMQPGGKTELETANTPNMDRWRGRHARADSADRFWHYPWFWPGAPVAVWL
jgi:hypothetical protein